MNKLKKYPIVYDKNTSSNVPGSDNFFQCKVVSDGDYGNMSLNPNLINVTFRGVTKPYILTTGHSIGPFACKINGLDIEPDDNLSNALTNSGKYYSINDTKSDRDFSLVSHDIISQIPRVVSFPGKFDNLSIRVSGIDLNPDKSKSYYKYGKTTEVTSAKIFLMLQKPKAQQILAECKTQSGKTSIYEIPNYSDSTYTIIQVSSNGVDDNMSNKDFLLTHDENFYVNTHFNADLNIEPNYQLYIYIAGFIEYLGYESNANNRTVLSTIIMGNNIGTKWFEAQRIGWVSLMGDSGSGFYSVEKNEQRHQTAQLLGINVEGCTMIKVKKLAKPIPSTEKIYVNWDEEKAQLVVGNYEIITAQKCSLVHSIGHIEQAMRDLTNEFVQIN
jgi:hypothetical protein